MEYKETQLGITRIGNYLMSERSDGLFSLTPIGQDNECWLTGEILCSQADAERIATVFTSQDVLTIGVREMMKRRAQEAQRKLHEKGE
jgi:hypothetical protein